jgi:hypothetical protein
MQTASGSAAREGTSRALKSLWRKMGWHPSCYETIKLVYLRKGRNLKMKLNRFQSAIALLIFLSPPSLPLANAETCADRMDYHQYYLSSAEACSGDAMKAELGVIQLKDFQNRYAQYRKLYKDNQVGWLFFDKLAESAKAEGHCDEYNDNEKKSIDYGIQYQCALLRWTEMESLSKRPN